MAPLRRYLRITKHSALEVRIYLDNPAHAETWLLRRNDPALPRIIEAVRPLVLPKLWEEKERSERRGKGKKGVKDVVAGDDFEVSIFLTDNSTPHALLTKQKTFQDKPRMKSNSGKLTGWLTTGGTSDKPVDVDAGDRDAPVTLREEDDEEAPVALSDIPEAHPETSRAGKRRRRESGSEDLFVNESSSASEDAFDNALVNSRTRKRGQAKDKSQEEDAEGTDDKKKLSLNTSYDGFSIYGRILCLVVKRKGHVARSGGGSTTSATAAQGTANTQQMMESWVSTQAAGNLGGDDEGED
ncbi:hypothetical protein BFW01_g11016 [Lasiodiplodia theobromae]|uniref:Uncharacterized protein n=2 Tax=Lasiodiplodia TaxID=66739 RepID=A0A5N5D3S9_9PEZI|nr:hypothetical protein DBV05_g9018 [Lasiodiplodia theobromae]KAF9629813.1 hypothetical protein BFW01_g11016 [Lasiodiplodia theobromae]KAK0642558.1 hypothetical protein DIS24_g8880 [Lasiodiplodia hormozganensis]